MATKAQLLTELEAKPRVHSVFSEVHNATRENLKAYTIGVMIYVTDEELLVKRISIQMVVTDESTPQEVAHWEQDRENNISQIEYPSDPEPGFTEKLQAEVDAMLPDAKVFSVFPLYVDAGAKSALMAALLENGGGKAYRYFNVNLDGSGRIQRTPVTYAEAQEILSLVRR